jgi:hypothetical protein
MIVLIVGALLLAAGAAVAAITPRIEDREQGGLS